MAKPKTEKRNGTQWGRPKAAHKGVAGAFGARHPFVQCVPIFSVFGFAMFGLFLVPFCHFLAICGRVVTSPGSPGLIFLATLLFGAIFPVSSRSPLVQYARSGGMSVGIFDLFPRRCPGPILELFVSYFPVSTGMLSLLHIMTLG